MMGKDMGSASALAAAASVWVISSMAIALFGILATIPMAAAEEEPAREVSRVGPPLTVWDEIRGMGLSGIVLVSLLLLAIGAIVGNLLQFRRLVRHLPTPNASLPKLAASTESFLIAPGALVGIGTVAVLVGAWGTTSSLLEAFRIIARAPTAPTPYHLWTGLRMSFLPASFGFLIGSASIGAGLVFRGLVALRRAGFLRAAARP